jgi:hypothetical protein
MLTSNVLLYEYILQNKQSDWENCSSMDGHSVQLFLKLTTYRENVWGIKWVSNFSLQFLFDTLHINKYVSSYTQDICINMQVFL